MVAAIISIASDKFPSPTALTAEIWNEYVIPEVGT